MRVAGLSWIRFRLPFRAPLVTARGAFRHRCGLLLRLSTDAGITGLGEASPHPALSNVAQLEKRLAALAPRLKGTAVTDLEAPDLGGRLRLHPALACALETAALDAQARARGVPLAALLRPDHRWSVPVNATIAPDSPASAAAQAAAARAAGFACVKMKVGAAPNPDEERRRVAAARAALGPHIALRLDANGAWELNAAMSIIPRLAEMGLELVEQPLPPGDPAAMAHLRRSVPVPIAADEDLTDERAALRLLEVGAADALVLKPMVLGGLRPALRIAHLAAAAHVSAIVTTTIDAAVGTTAALHLAAALGDDAPACGLATSSLLAADIVAHPIAAAAGRMALLPQAGLGLVLEPRWALALDAERPAEVV